MDFISKTIRYACLLFLVAYVPHCLARELHLNTEPVYFLVESPNLALDAKLSDSWSAGFQYAAIEGGRAGRNLSGLQFFYSRKGRIFENSDVLKVYLGRLSAHTKVLGIETNDRAIAMAEFLYGYRWFFRNHVSLSVQAGSFFTAQKIFPSVSVPVGYVF